MNLPAKLGMLLFSVIFTPSCCSHRTPIPNFASASQARVTKLSEPQPYTVKVHLDAGKYTSGYLLDTDNTWLFGSHDYYLTPGVHYIDVARVGRSIFSFTVGNNGQVTNISNPVAAQSTQIGLALNTVTIAIDPGEYGAGGGLCFLNVRPVSHHQFGWITERTSVELIPGLVYALDNGNAVAWAKGASYFYFVVRGDGSVWPLSDKGNAQSKGNTLWLNCGVVEITPPDDLPYSVGPNGKQYRRTPGHPAQEVPVVLDLRTSLRLKTGGPVAYFDPGYGAAALRKLTVGDKVYGWRVRWESNP